MIKNPFPCQRGDWEREQTTTNGEEKEGNWGLSGFLLNYPSLDHPVYEDLEDDDDDNDDQRL